MDEPPTASSVSTKQETDLPATTMEAAQNAQNEIPPLHAVLNSITGSDDVSSSHPTPYSIAIPQTASAHPPSPPRTAVDPNRQLDVSDALTYLDAVKVQFQHRPDVYNQFLDIMKDFKSQVIDTPGVIDRVSTLFNGHPRLIQGFNTFLPPGYRIECSMNPHEQIITVTTPTGTTTQSTDHATLVNSAAYLHSTHLAPPIPFAVPFSNSRPATPHDLQAIAVQSTVAPGSPMGYGSAHARAASFLGGLNGNSAHSDAPDAQGTGTGPANPEEFHHAIQYVNKIKTRFEDDPDTYKQFLEILHSYKKDNKVVDDSQVYAQVKALFKGAPDLLAEFKVFLPSAAGGLGIGRGSAGADAWAQPTGGPAERTDKRGARGEAGAAPKRKKRPIEKEIVPAPAPAPVTKSGTSRSKKLKASHNRLELQSPPTFPYGSRPQSPSQGHSHPAHAGQPSNQSRHTVYNPQNALAGPSAPSPADELLFFERAKKFLESRSTYEDFLKLLNLYSKEIIETKTLVERAETLFADSELLAQFKALLSFKEKKEGVEDIPPGSIRTWAVDSFMRASSSTDVRCGKSYRRLPDMETKLACSGRDELCRTVLNDVWVSHPIWASEESGFLTHKKNSYEEALHKSEEERHEYQFYIDIITRTIALFQPLHDRIMEMSLEERNNFRLPSNFGGSSQSIYHRAVKKVYGRDSGQEVLVFLQECPSAAVPVVLARLKQKSEEWRRAQRDWNRVWREVDARNFYKSLDHQGISFKANDKKNITTKSFVTEIETLKAEAAERYAAAKAKGKNKHHANDPSCPSFQLVYQFSDFAVLQDAIKLVFSFLDRSPGPVQYSPHERRAVEKMLREFLPMLCMMTSQEALEFDSNFGPPLETDNDDAVAEELAAVVGAATMDDADDADDAGSAPRSRSAKGGRRSANGGGGGIAPGDLRKRLLKTAQEKNSKSRSASRHQTPTPPDASPGSSTPASVDEGAKGKRNHGPSDLAQEVPMDVDDAATSGSLDSNKQWIQLMTVPFQPPPRASEIDILLGRDGIINQWPFFTNTTFYVLLRLLHLLYSRLLLCKETAEELAAETKSAGAFNVNPVAEELGLVDSSGPGAVLVFAAHAEELARRLEDDNAAKAKGRTRSRGNNSAPPSRPSSVPPQAPSPRGQSSTGILPPNGERIEKHFYPYLLDACEKLFEGDLDQTTFEENMRFLFGTKAYHLFTIDKVIASLIKQVHLVLMDSKCHELLSLVAKSRRTRQQGNFNNATTTAPTTPFASATSIAQQTQDDSMLGNSGNCQSQPQSSTMTVQELINYRREAERYLGGDDHLYRVEWVRNQQTMRIQLLKPSDMSISVPSFIESGPANGQTNGSTAQRNGDSGPVRQVAEVSSSAPGTADAITMKADNNVDATKGTVRASASLAKWRSYVASYVLHHRTEMDDEEAEKKIRKPYLSRTREEEGSLGPGGRVLSEGSMAIWIRGRNYQLLYENGREEAFWRVRGLEEQAALDTRASAARTSMAAWGRSDA